MDGVDIVGPSTNADGYTAGTDGNVYSLAQLNRDVHVDEFCVAVGKYWDTQERFWGLIDTFPELGPRRQHPLPSTNQAGEGPEQTQAPVRPVISLRCRVLRRVRRGGRKLHRPYPRPWGLMDTLSSGAWTASADIEPATDPAGYGPSADSQNHTSQMNGGRVRPSVRASPWGHTTTQRRGLRLDRLAV